MENGQSLTTSADKVEEGMQDVSKSLKALSSKMEVVPRENIILQNIFFPSMNMREQSIHDPESGTLRWVLEDGGEEGRYRPNIRQEEVNRRAHSREIFLNWLRSGGGVFHILGKAGSGKSTLMKFLSEHDRTRKELLQWAASEGKTLTFARFYFWSSGDDIQKSLAGLHRSILFETLKRRPELIPRVFPRHWDQLADRNTYIPGDLFTPSDFKIAFDTLTDHGAFSGHRFCFFIDGLDEFHGESEGHVQLAKSLQRWSSNGDVKICASSRPYLEFDDLAPAAGQKFYLHELTRHDIHLFSRQMIEKSDNFDQVKDSYLRLVDEIVDRSEGVFLWARLVVASLLAGMLRHDTTEALERKLATTPKDINSLYDGLLDALEPDDQERAAKLLITAATCSSNSDLPFHCRAYGWIDKFDDPDFPPCDGSKPPLWRAESAMLEAVQRQLKGLTKGLLEISYHRLDRETSIEIPVVGFFHRTVRDFVMNSPRILEISRKHPGLLEKQWHLRLLLADLTLATPEYLGSYWWWGRLIDCTTMFSEKKVPLNLSNGFRRIICDYVGSGVWLRDFIFQPWGPFSFVHFAAFSGQVEYVLHEVQGHPELLKGGETKNLLLSAALGGHRDLTAALIEKGASPTDHVLGHRGDDNDRLLVPVWLALSIIHIENYIRYGNHAPGSFDILECLFNAEGVDARNFVVLIGSSKKMPDEITHFTNLEEFIRDVGPNNKDRLLSLINTDKSSSVLGSLIRLAWRTSAVFKQSQDPSPVDTSAYSLFRLRDFKVNQFGLVKYVWDDNASESLGFEIY